MIGTQSSPPTYTEVSGIDKIADTGRKMGTAEATNFESTSEEFLSTLPSSGSWAISGKRVGNDPGQQEMEAAFNAGGLWPFKVQSPVNKAVGQSAIGDSVIFNAIIEKLNGISTFSCTLKVSGGITTTPGS